MDRRVLGGLAVVVLGLVVAGLVALGAAGDSEPGPAPVAAQRAPEALPSQRGTRHEELAREAAEGEADPGHDHDDHEPDGDQMDPDAVVHKLPEQLPMDEDIAAEQRVWGLVMLERAADNLEEEIARAREDGDTERARVLELRLQRMEERIETRARELEEVDAGLRSPIPDAQTSDDLLEEAAE